MVRADHCSRTSKGQLLQHCIGIAAGLVGDNAPGNILLGTLLKHLRQAIKQHSFVSQIGKVQFEKLLSQRLKVPMFRG